MSKRFLIGAIAVILAGIGLRAYLSWQNSPSRSNHSKKEIAENTAAIAAHKALIKAPIETVLVPLNMSQPVCLAIGSLGLADDVQNQQLGDLVTADLSGAQGFTLVERQSLDAILHELNLSLSGLVRAEDAVRAGKLLKADWFLLGTEAKINGTNSIVARVVDARTGILRDAGFFQCDKSPTQLAADIATFVRQSRQNAANAKPRVYLAIGAFDDLSLNSRQAAFPEQLRSYLTTAYQGANVTLLEREAVDILLQEARLDLAGLTENAGANMPQPLQSAYWLVGGYYQSYETTNFEVEVVLDINRMFGRQSKTTFRGLPAEPLFRQIKTTIDETLAQNSFPLSVSRSGEADAQLETGKELVNLAYFPVRNWPIWIVVPGATGSPQDVERNQRNMEMAVRAFETVLLLKPDNAEAKIYLGYCLRTSFFNRTEEARGYYREVLDAPGQKKRWTSLAQQGLLDSFKWESGEEKARWFGAIAGQETNSAAADFYRQEAESGAKEAIVESGESSKAVELAQQKLLEAIGAAKGFVDVQSRGRIGGTWRPAFGMYDFAEMFGTNRAEAAQQLVAFLPRMKKEYPQLAPHLLAAVVTLQVDTNAPIIADFKQMIDWCSDHPDQVYNVKSFWQQIDDEVYSWCFDHRMYELAANLINQKIRAETNGFTYPNFSPFRDDEKLMLAFAYLGQKHWQDALDIFECYSNRSIVIERDGPWGRAFTPVLTGKQAAYCREKLGLPAAQDLREFDMSSCLGMQTRSAFAVDANGLWVATGGQLMHLDFDLKTNLLVPLPVDFDTPMTCLCVGAKQIWVGTGGAGLIEFDKASRQCRRVTEADGLMMDYVSQLHLADNVLWIGFGGGGINGGVGQLDLLSQKLRSFMPSIDSSPNRSASTVVNPPNQSVLNIETDIKGDLWVLVEGGGFQRFHVADNSWESLPHKQGERVSSFAVNAERLVEGLSLEQMDVYVLSEFDPRPALGTLPKSIVIPVLELDQFRANLTNTHPDLRIIGTGLGGHNPLGALDIHTSRDGRLQRLMDADGLPNPPTTMTLDGDNLWVGGEGYIALVDLTQCKVRKLAHIRARTVVNIQIGGGYVWAQSDLRLYRAPLSDLQ